MTCVGSNSCSISHSFPRLQHFRMYKALSTGWQTLIAAVPLTPRARPSPPARENAPGPRHLRRSLCPVWQWHNTTHLLRNGMWRPLARSSGPTPSTCCHQTRTPARFPSGVTATPETESAWPSSVRRARPLSRSHTFEVAFCDQREVLPMMPSHSTRPHRSICEGHPSWWDALAG